MADRFSDAIGKHLLVWSGWVFTVGGAVGSFVLGQANAWIGWLAALTGILALTGHSYALHRRSRELEDRNAKLADQLRDAERKLNDVPLGRKSHSELVTPQTLTGVAARLACGC